MSYAIQCLPFYDLSDEHSELLDKDNLNIPELEPYWVNYCSGLPSYKAVTDELVRLINTDEIDMHKCDVRVINDLDDN